MLDDNNKKKERVEGRRDSTQRDTRVKNSGRMTDATDVTSASFETGQLRNSLSNLETLPKFNSGKPGKFRNCTLQLAVSGFETKVAVRLSTGFQHPIDLVIAPKLGEHICDSSESRRRPG